MIAMGLNVKEAPKKGGSIGLALLFLNAEPGSKSLVPNQVKQVG